MNQKNLRADLYKGVAYALSKDGCGFGKDIGKTTLLSSSFTGGPRHMLQLSQDDMACILTYGKPYLFYKIYYKSNVA